MTELHALTATELLEAFRKRTLSPVEVAQAVMRRIEAFNPRLNAFNLVSDRLLEEAKASEARWAAGQPKGLLDGVPVSIKDIILTRGWPTLPGFTTSLAALVMGTYRLSGPGCCKPRPASQAN